MWKLKCAFDSKPSFAVGGFLSADECRTICAMRLALPAQRATVGAGGVETQIRDSRVWWLMPQPTTAWLFAKLAILINLLNADHFRLDLDHLPSLQLTEYDAAYAGHYGQHIDTGYGADGSELRYRKLSIVMQLSEPADYDGGELILYPEAFTRPHVIERRQGSLVAFRSHIIHEARPVTRGTRLSLVGWVAGPDLK